MKFKHYLYSMFGLFIGLIMAYIYLYHADIDEQFRTDYDVVDARIGRVNMNGAIHNYYIFDLVYTYQGQEYVGAYGQYDSVPQSRAIIKIKVRRKNPNDFRILTR